MRQPKDLQVISIYEPIREQLARVEESIKDVAKLQFPFLAQLLDQVFETTGKRTRPAITLLSASFHPHDPAEIETLAAAVELLHIATLIHDDTVDNSTVRRGKATVGSLWGQNVAVLLGDYIFATSATFVCDTGNTRVIRRFSETIMELSSGELQELAEAYAEGQTMDSYLHRIHMKTASLFMTASESGAVLSGAPEETVQALRAYGYNLGMAFQIVDDILDFEGTEEEVGKPVGADLAHGIVTLPTLVAIRRHPHDNPIPALFQQPHDSARLARALDMIQVPEIIDESYAVAETYCRTALEALEPLESNAGRRSLEELVRYVLKRRH